MIVDKFATAVGVPGLVLDLPLICCFFRFLASKRSIVAGLTLKSFSLTSSDSLISRHRSRRITVSPSTGASLLAASVVHDVPNLLQCLQDFAVIDMRPLFGGALLDIVLHDCLFIDPYLLAMAPKNMKTRNVCHILSAL